MKLNIDVIFYEVSQKSDCQLHGDVNNKLMFSHPEILSQEDTINTNVLYISTPNILSKIAKPGVYICAGKHESPVNADVAIIFVDGMDIYRLFKLVLSVFNKYSEWDNALLTALNSHEPLKALAECSREIFANPMAVLDRDFHLLVHPFEHKEDYTAPLTSPDENGYLSLESVNSFKNDPYYNEMSNTRGAYLHFSGIRFYCINLFRNGECIARAVEFEVNAPFRPFDGFLLEHLALFMEPCLSYSGLQLRPDLHELRSTLRSILEGISERSVTKSELTSHGWTSSDLYFWLHLIQTELDINTGTERYTCIQIETKFPQTCAVQWSGGVSVLVGSTGGQQYVDDFLAILEEFLERGQFRAGVSRTFKGMSQLEAYHKQAVIAASVGKEKAADQWLYRFDDYALPYLIKNGAKDLPPMLCCHSAVQVLASYDHENGTEYLKTVRCYLENQMSLIETSRELFIHRSTMLYRLGRIKELVNIDWNNKDLVFHLMMSSRILGECEVIS